jgi:hypothetical protein
VCDNSLHERLDAVFKYLKRHSIKAYPVCVFKTQVTETLSLAILPDQDKGFISDLEFSTGFFIDLKYVSYTELNTLKKESREVVVKEGAKSPVNADFLRSSLDGGLKQKKIIQRQESLYKLFQIRVVEGLDVGLKVLVHDKGIIIGRKSEDSVVDLALQDKSVSKNHAKIIIDSFGKCIIKDLSSTNGTILNNKLIDTHVIHEGDVITIGHTKMRVEKVNVEKT